MFGFFNWRLWIWCIEEHVQWNILFQNKLYFNVSQHISISLRINWPLLLPRNRISSWSNLSTPKILPSFLTSLLSNRSLVRLLCLIYWKRNISSVSHIFFIFISKLISVRKHTRYLTIHRVVEQKSWHQLAYEDRLRRENRKIPKICRKNFLRWHLEQLEARKKFRRLREKNQDESIYVAKQWYYVLKKHPLKPRIEWSYQRVHK